MFGYSDEDGTEAESYDGKPARRGGRRAPRPGHRPRRAGSPTSAPASASAASCRCSSRSLHDEGEGTLVAEGRAEQQGPDVDGTTTLPAGDLRPGDVVPARVVAHEGVDLLAEQCGPASRRAGS
ncbi:hypothetical protein GCM10025868_07380 [Angustibacter aerolatus]|uniref:TRAM domain-containing protein n=1 Tax=Angustibacter aerolatus TaxID=1162965 RepID=A0ABQ6JDK0_9ACTN|nr:hypothetical protein [Angustibacter aerolatus]GMA85488.1 hypothetical protein GCM10025868_07380 [Angustibacter aerolatus]